MSILRLKCTCKKIIVENEKIYTFLLENYNESDMKKLLNQEIFMLDSHIKNMKSPEKIKKFKSFANNQEHNILEITNETFSSRQIIMLVTQLNDLTVKINGNIAKLVENINTFNEPTEFFLYVKLQKNVIYGSIISILNVCGIEIKKTKEIDQSKKIIDLIKKCRKESEFNIF